MAAASAFSLGIRDGKGGHKSDKGPKNTAIGVRCGSGSRLEPGSLCCLTRSGPWCLAACGPSSISSSGSGTRS